MGLRSSLGAWLLVLCAAALSPRHGLAQGGKPSTKPAPALESGKKDGDVDVGKPKPVFDSTPAKPKAYVGRGRRLPPGLQGMGKQAAIAIELGLEWLKNHQDKDGRWDCDEFMKHDGADRCDGSGSPSNDVAVTGLALLAFLGDGSSLRSGPYQEALTAGVKWLQQQQDQKTGVYGSSQAMDFIYGHAIATYAMSEAYGISEHAPLKESVEKAVGYLGHHRNPSSAWRYQPRDGDNDMSVTGWCIMAYDSARYFDIKCEEGAMKVVESWIDQVTDKDGRTGYTKVGEPSSRNVGEHLVRFPPEKGESMTALALYCRFLLGQRPDDKPVMALSASLIQKKPPTWNTKDGSIDFYYWYCASYAMFQMGGKPWWQWYAALDNAVVKSQRADGSFKGSWDPVDVWGENGGRVYATAMCVLTLESSYRYPPR